MAIAGDKGKVIDWGTYYNILGGDFVTTNQELGVWYRFDITTVIYVDFYDSDFNLTWSSYYVPEPMTMALLGLGGLFLRRRK